MKKVFLLVCVMLATMLSFAQETRKVAILETVDREGRVSYANKLILRSNLAKAITNTPGYEAYDRTDMDAILGEQNFQRTGMVSDEQIKRLGEMTGAKYVLVAEAAVVDNNTMYITAKLLDVETARTEMTDNQMMAANPKDIQRGCQLLAANLIKPIHTTATPQTVDAKAKTTSDKKQKKVFASESTRKQASGKGFITKISGNEYRLNGTKMDKKAYEKFLYDNCPEAWKKYKGGKNAVAAGWTLFSLGLAMQSGWILLAFNYGYDHTPLDLGISIGTIGMGCFTAGLITFSSGYGAKANALKTYNKKCAGVTPMTLNLKADQDGFGLALQF